MAAIDFAEMIGQVRERLGLHQSTVLKLGKAVGGLKLAEAEVERMQDAINVELTRIYAERHIGDTMHRVPHDIVETAEINDNWVQVAEPLKDEAVTLAADGGKWVNRPLEQIRLSNALDNCPDCGRSLIAASDGDTTVAALICSRLGGLKLDVPDLTPHDIVACGLEH